MSDDAIVRLVLTMHPKHSNDPLEYYVRKAVEITRKQTLIDMGILFNNKTEKWKL
jgi:hypothetical protein